MENTYNDAIDRAFKDDEKIIGDWTREARGKILDIQKEINKLNDKPFPKLELKGTPTANNFVRRNYLETEKQSIYNDLSEKIKLNYTQKSEVEKQTINDKIINLLDPNNLELKQKPLDASQDYMKSKVNAKKPFQRKMETNEKQFDISSDRFLQKLSSFKDAKNQNYALTNENVVKQKNDNKGVKSNSEKFERKLDSTKENIGLGNPASKEKNEEKNTKIASSNKFEQGLSSHSVEHTNRNDISKENNQPDKLDESNKEIDNDNEIDNSTNDNLEKE